MNTIQAIIVAVLQGATELFPVSSLGHAVVLPAVLHWNLDQGAPEFLPFLVFLHLGTAIALLTFFWRDWWALFVGVIGLGDAHQAAESRRVFLNIVVATIPAAVLGATLEHVIRGLFASPVIAAIFLVINGLLLLFGERIRGVGKRPLASLTIHDALLIGIWQCTALIPGISRSGATMVGGLLRGIDHEGSAHFSFLIATPIIFGATLHQVPKLLHAGVAPGVFGLAAFAAVISGLVAYASTWFLMRYFRSHEDWALNPFGYYCIGIGAVCLGLLFLA